jgi:hypothetical protein
MSGIFHLPLLSNSVPEQGNGDYRVRFYDYDGTLLKEEWVEDSLDATAPQTPTHENLTFYGWNKTFSNVTKNLDVGAIYDSANGDTYLYITLNTLTGLSPILYFYKGVLGSGTTIYWGDGTSNTYTGAGTISAPKTYAQAGNYVIRISTTLNIALGSGTSSNRMFGGNYNSSITKVIIGNLVVLQNYTFYLARSLKTISFGRYLTSIPQYCFQGCLDLTGITLPNGVTTLSMYCFSTNTSLHSVSLPESLTSLSTQSFYYCSTLRSIIIPSGVSSLSDYVFYQAGLTSFEVQGNITALSAYCLNKVYVESLDFPSTLTSIYDYALSSIYTIKELIFRSTTPPTITASTFDFFNLNKYQAKIYVPDASVNSYKAATNWLNYANYIYPLSSRP